MRTTIGLILFVLALTSNAHAQSVNAQILDATVRYIYSPTDPKVRLLSKPNVVIKVHPVILRSNGMIPTIDPNGLRHSEEVLSRIGLFSGSAIVTPVRASECAANAPDDCMSNGISAVINLSEPVIRGDSAYVDIYFRASVKVSGEDSVRMAKSQLTTQLRRAGEGGLRASLAKTSNGWVVTKMTFVWQT